MKKDYLKKIIDKNRKEIDAKIQSNLWTIKYDRTSDMLILGEKIIPKETFYTAVGDSGILIRVDEKDNIYGFAIENVKYVAEKNPELKEVLTIVKYPVMTLVLGKIANFFKTVSDDVSHSNSFAIKKYVLQQYA